MARYDRQIGNRFSGARYDRDLAWSQHRAEATNSPGFWGRGVGLYRAWGTQWEAPPPSGGSGYDRGFGRQARGYDASYGRHRGDAEIRQLVRQNLQQDTWVDAGRIEVTVQDGVVTLSGEVDEYLVSRYAWDDAWEADGVEGVNNEISVRDEGEE